MDQPQSNFRKLGFSVLQGAAFMIGGLLLLFVAGLALSGYLVRNAGEEVTIFSTSESKPIETTGERGRRRVDNPERFEFSLIQEVKRDDRSGESKSCAGFVSPIQFVGTIENKGGDSQRQYMSIYADLFDREGAFIFQCTTQVAEPLKQGEKVNFMISCHQLPHSVLERYATFKVYTREK